MIFSFSHKKNFTDNILPPLKAEFVKNNMGPNKAVKYYIFMVKNKLKTVIKTCTVLRACSRLGQLAEMLVNPQLSE